MAWEDIHKYEPDTEMSTALVARVVGLTRVAVSGWTRRHRVDPVREESGGYVYRAGDIQSAVAAAAGAGNRTVGWIRTRSARQGWETRRARSGDCCEQAANG